MVRVRVLAIRRPDAQLTCRAVRETPATEYRVIDFTPNDRSHLPGIWLKRHQSCQLSCRCDRFPTNDRL